MIKISIIVPVYNVAPYISRCLNSVAHQTYAGPIECVLVDDCGRDNSVQIIDEFVANYSGDVEFQLVHHEHNRGLSAARNTGLSAATGDYIFFLDSDDELLLNAIDILIEQVNQHPDIEMVQGFTQSIPMVNYYDTHCFEPYQYISDNLWIRNNYYCLGKTIPVNGVNKLLKRDFLINNQLYFKEGLIHEDEHWMFFLVKQLQTMAFVFEPTYIRYFNEGSIMQTMNEQKEGYYWGMVLHDWIKRLDEISCFRQLQKILSLYSKHLVYKYYHQNDAEFFKSIVKALTEGHKWKSLMWLLLWRSLLPIKSVKKMLRFATESLS